jgi:hypothetical protein
MPFDVISNVDYRYSSIKIDKFQYVCINGYLFRNIYIDIYYRLDILVSELKA